MRQRTDVDDRRRTPTSPPGCATAWRAGCSPSRSPASARTAAWTNGAATAEIQARQYASIGVGAYSSAVHAFAPEIADAFFAAHRDGDDHTVERLLRGFYVPLVELRDRVPGYAVSLVKAAARLRGKPVGPVRAPLTEPGPDDLAALEALLADGLDLAGATA